MCTLGGGCRLFSHLDDPFLDDPLPREFVLYLRPSGPLQNQLSHFWQQSRVTCGKNKAHNIFPHITLCQFFMVSPQGRVRVKGRLTTNDFSITNRSSSSFSSFTTPLAPQCADPQVEALCEALKASVQQWRGRFPSPLPLDLYTSSNFIGLFVEKQAADVLKLFAADFATEASRMAGRNQRRGEAFTHNAPFSQSPCNGPSGLQRSTWSLTGSSSM